MNGKKIVKMHAIFSTQTEFLCFFCMYSKNLASLISKVIEAAMKGNDIKGAVAFFEESLVLYEGIRFDITPFVQLVNQCEVARKRDLTKRILACLMSRKVSSELLDCMFLIALVRYWPVKPL